MHKRDILVYILGTFALMIAMPLVIVAIGIYMPYPFLPENLMVYGICALLSLSGILLTVFSNIELLKKGKGGPAVFGSIKLMEETKHLVTTGPYALCRNPMHTGLILLYIGVCGAVNSLFSLIIPLMLGVGAFLFAKFLDEPRLHRDFGESYERWAERTPRFLPKIFR